MSLRNLFEAKFKTVDIEEYELIIRKGYKELIVTVQLPGSTGRWTMDGENVRKIQDTFDADLKVNYWSKKDHMIKAITKATKADEIEINRIR